MAKNLTPCGRRSFIGIRGLVCLQPV